METEIIQLTKRQVEILQAFSDLKDSGSPWNYGIIASMCSRVDTPRQVRNTIEKLEARGFVFSDGKFKQPNYSKLDKKEKEFLEFYHDIMQKTGEWTYSHAAFNLGYNSHATVIYLVRRLRDKGFIIITKESESDYNAKRKLKY